MSNQQTIGNRGNIEKLHTPVKECIKKRIKPKLGSCVGIRWKRPRRRTRRKPEERAKMEKTKQEDQEQSRRRTIIWQQREIHNFIH